MARYIVLALNGPTSGEGDEQAYNEWYEQVHLPELLAVDGINAGRRYKVLNGTLDRDYVAIYEIETDDFEGTMKAMTAASSGFPPYFDASRKDNIIAVEIA